jgi:hypothetical protein
VIDGRTNFRTILSSVMNALGVSPSYVLMPGTQSRSQNPQQ